MSVVETDLPQVRLRRVEAGYYTARLGGHTGVSYTVMNMAGRSMAWRGVIESWVVRREGQEMARRRTRGECLLWLRRRARALEVEGTDAGETATAAAALLPRLYARFRARGQSAEQAGADARELAAESLAVPLAVIEQVWADLPADRRCV